MFFSKGEKLNEKFKNLIKGMTEKTNFWNGWDFKTILTIITVIVTAAFFFARMESKIESNQVLNEMRFETLKSSIDEIKVNVRNDNYTERDRKLYEILKELRNK